MKRSALRLLGTCTLGLAVAVGVAPALGAGKTPKPTRYRLDVPDSGIDIGAAKVKVEAPADEVQAAVLDFNEYSEMIHKFNRARVVGKANAHTDVYLQVPILKGLAKVWAVLRFTPPTHEGDTIVVSARMLKGNVDDLTAEWRIQPLTSTTSELHLRMRIVPRIPAPGGLVTDEVAAAADQAVRGIRAAAEAK
jgi:ribosome-associated toxin RatA of RatAB toxin-antitoxin module